MYTLGVRYDKLPDGFDIDMRGRTADKEAALPNFKIKNQYAGHKLALFAVTGPMTISLKRGG